jgi:chromosome segregation ATPase
MNEKSKDLDLIPAIKPAQDEVASYQRSSRSDAPKQSNFNGVLVFVIVLMAIMMGVGGFALYEVQQRLDLSNQLLAKAQENVRELENRLSQTGDTASQRFQSMEAQIKTNVSEVDKLWAVAYRQNRPSIQENVQAIEAVQKSVDQVDARIRQLVDSMAAVRQDFDSFSDEMVEVRQNLLTDNQEMVTQVSLVRSQIQDQAVLVEGNRRTLAALDQKMGDVDEAIKAIDSGRQLLNNQLRELRNQIQGSEPTPE